MCIDPMRFLEAGQSAAEANYRAQIARNRQQMAERQAGLFEDEARRSEQQGAAEVDRRRLRTAQSLGTARAELAAQGGDLASGSAPDLLGDIARAGEGEARAVRDDAAQLAWRARLRAMGAANDAGLAGAEAGRYEGRAGETWTLLGTRAAFDLGRWL